MEKVKKKESHRFGMTIGELCTVVIAVLTLVCGGFIYVLDHFDERFEKMDQKFDRRFESMDQKFTARFDSLDRRLGKVERRLDKVESRLDNLEIEVKKTSSLLHNYLTWRFLYIHDPKRKNIEPRYDPNERTLEFVDKSATKSE